MSIELKNSSLCILHYANVLIFNNRRSRAIEECIKHGINDFRAWGIEVRTEMKKMSIDGRAIQNIETDAAMQKTFAKRFNTTFKSLKNWRPTKGASSAKVDVLDFFSGCGGMSLGFAAASKTTNQFRIVGGVDISTHALKSYEKNFNAKTLNRDIREIYLNKEYKKLADYFGINKTRKRPLVIIGCAPCQGFSAHRKKNWHKDDERNTLIGAFVDVALAFNPDFIVMENVPEIFSSKYEQHYQEATESLKDKGYKIAQTLYNSAGFGVPQARYRAVIVASKSDFTLPKEILSAHQYKTVRDAIGDLPKIKAGEISKDDVYHRSASHKKSTLETISQVPKDGGNRPLGIGPKCLDKVKGFSDVYGRLSWDKPSITITQYSRNPASGRFTHPVQNRGLTIREAARIQSFPDGYVFEGSLDECFKQIGEAVPPLLAVAIATQIGISIDLKKEKKDYVSQNNQKQLTSRKVSGKNVSLKTRKVHRAK